MPAVDVNVAQGVESNIQDGWVDIKVSDGIVNDKQRSNIAGEKQNQKQVVLLIQDKDDAVVVTKHEANRARKIVPGGACHPKAPEGSRSVTSALSVISGTSDRTSIDLASVGSSFDETKLKIESFISEF